MSEPREISLFYREGSSDKVYNAFLKAKDGGFVVDFAYGRRGSTLTMGTKTQKPVGYAEAAKIYDKIVKEKTSKGYVPVEGARPFTVGPEASKASGLVCQLLNPVEDEGAGPLGWDELLVDDSWMAQRKYDGERRLVQIKNGRALGINRNGLYVPLEDAIAREAEQLAEGTVLDAEIVGDRLYVFDILWKGQEDVRSRPAAERIRILGEVLSPLGLEAIVSVFGETAMTAHEKSKLVDLVRRENGEGVVFKKKTAPYTPGRPNSGGTQLKMKFWASATVRVSAINDKRSVALQMRNGDGWRNVGNVTIPPNKPIPVIGQIVEVRYLYALDGSFNLYQPTYLGTRGDKLEDGVDDISTLQLKPETESAPVAAPRMA